ncbi:MAG: hypothetical protein AAF713_07875 [Pseudomonadota bacterium]
MWPLGFGAEEGLIRGIGSPSLRDRPLGSLFAVLLFAAGGLFWQGVSQPEGGWWFAYWLSVTALSIASIFGAGRSCGSPRRENGIET